MNVSSTLSIKARIGPEDGEGDVSMIISVNTFVWRKMLRGKKE